jgi:hypothetical protein
LSIIFFTVIIFSIVATTTKSVLRDWDTARNEIVAYSAGIKDLHNKKGVLTGNARSALTGAAAYLVKREYWNAINPELRESYEAVWKRLKLWEAEQVLWLGAPYNAIEEIPGIIRHGPWQINGEVIYVYDLPKAVPIP